jgi:hypothetical protein
MKYFCLYLLFAYELYRFKTYSTALFDEPAASSHELFQPPHKHSSVNSSVLYNEKSLRTDNFLKTQTCFILLKVFLDKVGLFDSSSIINYGSSYGSLKKCVIVISIDTVEKLDVNILIHVTKLSVDCNRGDLLFLSGVKENFTLCGKWKDLREKSFYFESLNNVTISALYNQQPPKFSFSYKIVDYCYKTTYLEENKSFVVDSKNLSSDCNFKVIMNTFFLLYTHTSIFCILFQNL